MSNEYQTNVIDIYVKGEKVFSYIRGRDDFNENDIEVKFHAGNAAGVE